MSSILIRTAVIVLLLALLGFGTGLLFGAIWGWSFFSLGLIGLLAHHVWHLRLLRQWASSPLTEAVPEGSGAWEEVFMLLYRRQRADAARSRRLAPSLARPRQAAGRFRTASRSWTPNTASSGATIPAKRTSASAPKPMSAT